MGVRKKKGKTKDEAKALVASEFPTECGACALASSTGKPTGKPTRKPTRKAGLVCDANTFDNSENKCERCSELQPPCDDCVCGDFTVGVQESCKAACLSAQPTGKPTAAAKCVDTRASGSGLHGDDSRGSYANGLSSQCEYYKKKNQCGTWGKGCKKTCGLCSSNSEEAAKSNAKGAAKGLKKEETRIIKKEGGQKEEGGKNGASDAATSTGAQDMTKPIDPQAAKILKMSATNAAKALG